MNPVTPDQIDAGLQGVALVLSALGGLVAAIIAAVAAVRAGKSLEKSDKVLEKTTSIEKSTNGAVDAAAAIRLALETRIAGLEALLAHDRDVAVAAAVAAKQAAADVQTGIATPQPPNGEAGS